MKRRILAMLLALSLILSLAPMTLAAGEEKSPDDPNYGFTYRFVTSDTIEITSYYGYEAEVTVPSSIDGYTVVGIQSFHSKEGYSTPNKFVTKVILPNTVTYIADDAFYDDDDWGSQTHSSLREIVLPEGLKIIGERAFFHSVMSPLTRTPVKPSSCRTRCAMSAKTLSPRRSSRRSI